MDVIIIFNGLGNQMSQYALFLQKKSINESTHLISFCDQHNGLELDTVFKIELKKTFLTRLLFVLFKILMTKKLRIFFTPIQKLLNLGNCNVVKENFNYNFNRDYLRPSKGITFYYGGWHSDKYFLNVLNQVRAAFEFNKPDDGKNANHISNILKCNSVALHVRRGDYLDNDNFNLFGEVCTKAYFEAAVNIISIKVASPRFFVFSNDIEWVKHNLNLPSVTYVSCNEKRDSWKDMYLMSLCKCIIISNSTFSWWGAWLNKNEDKMVISPSRFLKKDEFSNVYPDSWIKLSDR